jgi:hypothetical protein
MKLAHTAVMTMPTNTAAKNMSIMAHPWSVAGTQSE